MLLDQALPLDGTLILVGVTAEQTSRDGELRLVPTRPERLLAGKLLGIGTAGLVLFLAVALVGGAVFALDPRARHVAGATSPGAVPLWGLPLLVVFFLGGFFLFSAVDAAAGRPEEAGPAGALPTLGIVVAFASAILGLDCRPGAPPSRTPPASWRRSSRR